MAIAEAIVGMRVRSVLLVGGEPLLVPDVFRVIEHLKGGGIDVHIYTNGINMKKNAARLAALGAQVHVSIDGATAETNDRTRGKPGSFRDAIDALAVLNEVALARIAAGEAPLRFGIDVVLVQSNFHELHDFATEISPRFSEMTFMQLGGVIPSGLAARSEYARREVLTNSQNDVLMDAELAIKMKSRAHRNIEYVSVAHNLSLQLHSSMARQVDAPYANVMEIEPDGGVRGIVTYEGTVGNILQDAPEVLWKRCQERIVHPFVVEQLRDVKNGEEWAAAVRTLDEYFVKPHELARLRRHREYLPPDSPSVVARNAKQVLFLTR